MKKFTNALLLLVTLLWSILFWAMFQGLNLGHWVAYLTLGLSGLAYLFFVAIGLKNFLSLEKAERPYGSSLGLTVLVVFSGILHLFRGLDWLSFLSLLIFFLPLSVLGPFYRK